MVNFDHDLADFTIFDGEGQLKFSFALTQREFHENEVFGISEKYDYNSYHDSRHSIDELSSDEFLYDVANDLFRTSTPSTIISTFLDKVSKIESVINALVAEVESLQRKDDTIINMTRSILPSKDWIINREEREAAVKYLKTHWLADEVAEAMAAATNNDLVPIWEWCMSLGLLGDAFLISRCNGVIHPLNPNYKDNHRRNDPCFTYSLTQMSEEYVTMLSELYGYYDIEFVENGKILTDRFTGKVSLVHDSQLYKFSEMDTVLPCANVEKEDMFRFKQSLRFSLVTSDMDILKKLENGELYQIEVTESRVMENPKRPEDELMDLDFFILTDDILGNEESLLELNKSVSSFYECKLQELAEFNNVEQLKAS